MKTKIYAHRGASAYAPENTMEAFRLAYEMGADGLEIDVHLSKDGKVVVIHDASIDRTSDGSGLVSDMTYEALYEHDYASKFQDQYKNVRIPLLDDVLAFVKENGMILNIEIKFGQNQDNGIEQKVADLIQAYDVNDQIIISSFHHVSLSRIKGINSSFVTAPLYSQPLYHPCAYAKTFDAEGLHPGAGVVDASLMKACKESGMFLNVWTVDNPKDIKKFMSLGVDGLITNVPDVAKSLG